MASQLPEYMIPAFFTQLESMPLTVNRKIDYQALPSPSTAGSDTNLQSRPLSSLEKSIAEILQSVLGLETVSCNDNFFEIGVNSLNLVTVKNRIKQVFKRDIPLTILFEYTSIARLAEYLKTDKDSQIYTSSEDNKEIKDTRDFLLKTEKLFRKLEDENF